MRSYLLLLIACFTLSACVTNPLARINAIRAETLPKVNRQLAKADLRPGAHTYIRIFKEEAILEAWLRDDSTGTYRLYKTYPICNYSGALGPKIHEGDMQAPEGFYDVTEEWLWPQSVHHLAMNIGFPNEYDKARGRTGSHIMIHGGCKSEGCYAMTDKGIEEIYLLVEQSLVNNPLPVPVHIFPFKMTAEKLAQYEQSPWAPFWTELRLGYNAFERNRVPPIVSARNGHYRIKPQVFVRREGV